MERILCSLSLFIVYGYFREKPGTRLHSPKSVQTTAIYIGKGSPNRMRDHIKTNKVKRGAVWKGILKARDEGLCVAPIHIFSTYDVDRALFLEMAFKGNSLPKP